MSDIETITTDLQAMAAGVEKAQTAAAAADRTAQEVALRAVRSGFVGIAAGLTAIREAVKEIQGRVGGLANSIRDASKPVAAAAKEGSPQQTIAVLSTATTKVTSAREGLTAAVSKISDVQRLATIVLQGGQPAPLVSALEGIKGVLIEVAQRADVTKDHLGAAMAEARRIGEAKN